MKSSARHSQKRQASQAYILDAAARVATRDGIPHFTLDAVAAEAGLTKQGLLYHFPSKDDLAFEMFIREWTAAAHAIFAGVALATSGAQALEAIIRSYVAYHAPRLELFRLVTQNIQLYQATPTAAQFARIRPLNDVMYGEATRKLLADQKAKRLPKGAKARRLAFSAHLAAIGILSMKALVENFGDPLLYSDAELVDDMCGVFRRACKGEGRWTK